MPRKNSHQIKLVSIVVPAYMQEKTILKDIKKIDRSLQLLGCNYEVIVVIDGVVDNTFKKALKVKSPNIRVIAYEKNQGKGHAVRYGMMHAKGDIIGYIDAGMDINLSGFQMLLSHMNWYDADIIIGSKLHPVSKVNYPLNRTILSWGYRFIIATLFGFKVKDSQVGIKFFKRKVVRKVLPKLLVKSYAFDVEMLAVAHSMGYTRIFEAPVQIDFSYDTSIVSKTIWKTIFFMFWDTLAVFYRLHILKYYSRKKIKKITHQRIKFSLGLTK